MWRWGIGLFLVAHGLVHLAVWATPAAKSQRFDPSHSWALQGAGMSATSVRSLSTTLAWVAATLFVLGGLGLIVGADAWRPVTIAGSVLGLTMAVVWFHPWFVVDVAINAGLLYALTT
jgi:hypothetical protein